MGVSDGSDPSDDPRAKKKTRPSRCFFPKTTLSAVLVIEDGVMPLLDRGSPWRLAREDLGRI
jgi:hypothetical protein